MYVQDIVIIIEKLFLFVIQSMSVLTLVSSQIWNPLPLEFKS